MEIVKSKDNLETLNQNIKDDFYVVPNLKFNIDKLRTDLNIVLKKEIQHAGYKKLWSYFIKSNSGDKSSTEGHNVRGTYWTIPDEKGKEIERDKPINESNYTEIVPEFKGTYFEEVYNTLRKHFKLGRVRILLKEPRSTLSWHRDPEPRLHIPIITNKGCRMVIEEVCRHMPADGSVTITNNTKYHNFFNGGEQDRIHLVACVLENPFN